ncbi:hypothetical protein XM38_045320 [Halomicronema hongdechloris C2206]|uniref:Uncharacterized protein n=1 Tax=Halomicronema hongdechloris C2206 TaxID=1641165 RepID=A0A1Z3HTC6_9CYAN|nr:hypothetical protein [Halomicronema hongdechloris]ASC73563.1 hypothetical protein XM38_045320 [Halomicronema hongdechloris C2206]
MATQIPPLSAPPGYRTQAEDTGVETDLLCFYLLRQKTVSERLQMGAQLTRSARQLSLNCFHQRFAHLKSRQFARKIAEAWLQEHCPPDYVPGGSEVSWIQDSIQLAVDLHRILTAEDIPYYVTGGVAAIAYGESRTTQDLDVVLFMSRQDIPLLVRALEQAGFYVPGVDDVMAGRLRTLQVTQVDTISRADLVIADTTAYEQQKLERRQLYALTNESAIYLVSPEDLVVNKLRWGRQSQSQKQWRDVLGVLKAQQDSLDYQYMHRWAAAFDLSIGLEQATLEAGVNAIANHQWAIAAYPIMSRAFAMAQARNRTTHPSPNVEVADGNRYRLTRDDAAQRLTVVSKLDDREIARYDSQGTVLRASPSLQDRQQWHGIAERVMNSCL